MIEKVNPNHPDKVADRIAGAIVDLAYTKEENPNIAVEVLIGHKMCHIITESSVQFEQDEIQEIVKRIAGFVVLDYTQVPQDEELAKNQAEEIRCGDNGIFKGVPLTNEEIKMSNIARAIYDKYHSDGKYILDYESNKLVVCQSNAKNEELKEFCKHLAMYNMYDDAEVIINPLGEWTGGTDVDTGATNRKLGSDMAQSLTGGGLHGKDLSKADVSINIYAFLKAQKTGEQVELCCAIGDTEVDGLPYSQIVQIAREYINAIGGFEKFAEWGLF